MTVLNQDLHAALPAIKKASHAAGQRRMAEGGRAVPGLH